MLRRSHAALVIWIAVLSLATPWCRADTACWNFSGDLSPSAGAGAGDLIALGFPGAAGAPGVTFASEMIEGEPADVAEFTEGTALQVLHGLLANGGGSYLNVYTLIMDVRLDEAGVDWTSLYQTNNCDAVEASTDLTCTNDGDWFINPAGGIGIGGNYGGTTSAGVWMRLALVVDSGAGTYTSYINGAEVQQNTGVGVDGRFALYTTDDGDPASDSFFLFADETGISEMSGGAINSVCIVDSALDAGALAALGGPTAAGLPSDLVVPTPEPNETCADALALDFGGGTTAVASGDTTLSAPDPENDSCGDSNAPGVWYSLTGNGATITASTCNAADFDTRLSVFSGVCGALECVVENDDTGGCAGNTSQVAWNSTVGVEYFILVHGFSTSAGSFTLTVERPESPCVRLLDAHADNGSGMLSVAWESFAQSHDGYRIEANGVVAGEVGPDERSFSWTPELVPGRLNDFRVSVAVLGDSVAGCAGGAVSGTLWLSPGSVCLAETFDYESDVALEVDGGWFLLDENTPAEDATWTLSNPGARANPPTVDGTPTFGGFVVSDSDAAGGSNPPGSGMSHDLWSPLFSLEGKTEAYLHLDLSAQLNNNGEAVFDIDVSTDEGTSWTTVHRRVAPARSAAPIAIDNAALVDGFYGRLDVDLSSVAGESNVRLRFRHFEPNDDWWIAIDNVVVDDIAPLAPAGATLYANDFSAGLDTMRAVSLLGNSCEETWHVTDKGGRRLGVGNFDGRGANRLALLAPGADFVACLSGAQEVPPNDSEGTGEGVFTYDADTRELGFSISYSGLSAPESNAHIHLAPPGASGGVAQPLPAGNPKEGSVVLTVDQATALLAGELYVNIHSQAIPAGELRGQILPNAGFAILDSDANPDPAEDEWLLTPSIDCSELTEVRIHWLSETVASGAVQEVLVSLDGGASFLERKLFDYRGGGAVDLGEEPFFAQRGVVVPEAAGAADVVFAFHWVGQDNWWWAVDEILVSGVLPVVGGSQKPGDFNQDGNFDISDNIALLSFLFLGGASPPCGDNSVEHPSNVLLLDANGDQGIDLSDAVYGLSFLFLGGPAPALGTDCVLIELCPDACP